MSSLSTGNCLGSTDPIRLFSRSSYNGKIYLELALPPSAYGTKLQTIQTSETRGVTASR
jgi:hypothetical protein